MNLETFTLIALVGFLATYVHMIIALWVSEFGLPRLDFSRVIANLNFSGGYKEDPPYLLGMASVHLNGIVFALIYATLVGPHLPGTEFERGLMWGGILFFASQIIFVPIVLKDGLFLRKLHPKAWITALIAHIVFGAILGWLCPIVN